MSDEEFSFDKTQANLQVSLTDTNRRQRTAFTWAGVNASLGRTDFEGYQLNAMLDMIESARPGDLEAAADALANASDAIEGVGEDIKKYAANVDWEGESGDAFRTWADNLGKNTLKLATYTGQAGVQMRAASIGLASVKSGMPPREQGPYLPMDTEKANAADDPREKNRQEAITQMNRLSSFYTVSRDTMAAQEEPTFAPPPDLGVPKADAPIVIPAEGNTLPDRLAGSPVSSPGGMPSASAGTNVEAFPLSASTVATEINNASLPAALPEQANVRHSGTTNGQPSGLNSFAPLPVTAARQGWRQETMPSQGMGKAPKQAAAPYRPNAAPRANASHGGLPSASGRAAGPPAPYPSPAGRAPQAPALPLTGRPDAVVGGTPYRPAPPVHSPIHQGTVAGSERGATGRPMVGQPGAAGPIGGPGRTGSDRRWLNERGGNSAILRTASGDRGQRTGFFTPGGMGLVHRPSAARTETCDESDEGARPDYLSEDQSTWKDRKSAVPPVVE